jgi:predicted dithiol-disulfide oxidoreductase (DUF899 family)
MQVVSETEWTERAWTFLDLTPLGRQERGDSPPYRPQTEPYTWWRRHDEYKRS